jgi:hypothetical protein
MTTTLEEIPHYVLVGRIEELYRHWEDGSIQSEEALKRFCEIMGPVQDKIKLLDQADKQARIYVSEIVEFLGGKVEVNSFGKLEITNPSVTYSYDRKQVDRFVDELREEGHYEIANRLVGCLKPSERAGSLRITRTKEKELESEV